MPNAGLTVSLSKSLTNLRKKLVGYHTAASSLFTKKAGRLSHCRQLFVHKKVQASFYFDTRIIEEAWIYRSNLKNHLRGTNVKPQRYSRSAGKVWNGSGRAPQLS